MFTSTNRRPGASQRQAIRAAEQLFRPSARPSAQPSNGCPGCGSPAPVAPVRSRLRGEHTVEHDWSCGVCGRAWHSVAIVSAPAPARKDADRFEIGSLVRMIGNYGSRTSPMEVFEVVAQRAGDSGGVHYRIRSAAEAFERVVDARNLRAASDGGLR